MVANHHPHSHASAARRCTRISHHDHTTTCCAHKERQCFEFRSERHCFLKSKRARLSLRCCCLRSPGSSTPRRSTASESAGGCSRRRDCHFTDIPPCITTETPSEGRGGCSRITVSPTARRLGAAAFAVTGCDAWISPTVPCVPGTVEELRTEAGAVRGAPRSVGSENNEP